MRTFFAAIELDAFQVPDAQMLREILSDRKLNSSSPTPSTVRRRWKPVHWTTS